MNQEIIWSTEGHSLKSVARCLSLVARASSFRGEEEEVRKSYCVNSIALWILRFFFTIYHIRYTTYEHSDGRNCPEVFIDKKQDYANILSAKIHFRAW